MIKIALQRELITSHGPLCLDVDFSVGSQELITLLGASGSGKTSLLRMIAGLMRPQKGQIEVDGQIWFSQAKGINLRPQERSTSMVFQDYNLFPHMTVYENCCFALRDKRDLPLIEQWLQWVDLQGLQHRKPHQLSGGQKQRVALVRALLHKPKIFLLDEPFAALDETMRLRLQEDIRLFHRRLHVPMIIVTHDLSESYKLSDRIIFLDQGKILKQGAPQQMFAAQTLSGKFQLMGQILEIIQDETIWVVTIQVGANLTKVAATSKEVVQMKVGDRVIVSTKAFNPIIFKVS